MGVLPKQAKLGVAMKSQNNLQSAAGRLAIAPLSGVPELPTTIMRSRWAIARCAIFVGVVAVSFAVLLLNLSWRAAIAG
jgi:hypothetical protein